MLTFTYITSITEFSLEVNILYFSCAIIYLGSINSLDQYSLRKENEGVQSSKGFLGNLLSSTQMIWLFPIISSIFLMIAYLTIKSSFNKTMMTFVLFFVGWTGTLNLASYLRTAVLKYGGENLDVPIPILQNIQFRFFTFRLTFLSFMWILISSYITYSYLKTKYWIYNNILAISFCVYFLNKLLVTNYRNAIIYLVGMLIYDIFWVFGSDVMVTVASQLDLPIKLMFPKNPNAPQVRYNIIGIGDIALPGIFWAMMLRYDFLRAVTQTKESFTIENFEKLKDSLDFKKPYFYTALWGYSLGLLTTIIIFKVFNSAQPALLYINPFMLGSSIIMATLWKSFRVLFYFDEDRFIEEQQNSNAE